MKTLIIENFARIKKAEIAFGDLTVFVGPQATGKTLILELMKLVEDKAAIANNLKRYGFDWDGIKELLSLYFGEGMSGIWQEGKTKVVANGREFNLNAKGKKRAEKVFFIPAQRILALKDGWPRAFTEYSSGDPYVVKNFSEELRLFMESGLGRNGAPIFPQKGRMLQVLGELFDKSIFWGAELTRSREKMRRRLALKVDDSILPFMVWSAGQREFIPLLLGLYWLMPSGKKEKRENITTVVIEEPEMGLHPRALEAVMVGFLELMRRGYRVCVSTHSPQVLEMIWVIKAIKSKGEKGVAYLEKLFGAKGLEHIWKSTLSKDYKVFYFHPKEDGVEVRDISSLELLEEDVVTEWGGLTSFATRASEIVSEIAIQEE
ncbi:AAA family ATPase [Palaeococcus sp. (in: euryarchaeotes)]